MKIIKLQINTKNHKYPIIIGSGLITKISKLLNNNSVKFSKCLLVIDNKIPKKLINKIFKSLQKKQTITHFFNANEVNKNQSSVNKILKILLKKNFHRDDCLISIGGGITGDVAGFASSIFKRGIKFINIPTTLLAQVDSSIGGKTGINSRYGKNLIGSFYQPNLVISDINFLKTLPRREITLLEDSNDFIVIFSSKFLKKFSPFFENISAIFILAFFSIALSISINFSFSFFGILLSITNRHLLNFTELLFNNFDILVISPEPIIIGYLWFFVFICNLIIFI